MSSSSSIVAATSEGNFFLERNEAFDLITILSSSSSSSSASSYPSFASASSSSSCGLSSSSTTTTGGNGTLDDDDDDGASKDASLSRLRTILDRYLECPTLLDPHMEGLVNGLCRPARDVVRDLYHRLHHHRQRSRDGRRDDEDVDGGAATAAVVVVHDDPTRDAESSHDGTTGRNDIDGVIFAKLGTLMRLLSALYAISKVRGRKHVQRLMPHEASDLEPVLLVLRWFGYLDGRDGEGGMEMMTTTTTTMPIEIARYRDGPLRKREDRGGGCDDGGPQVWESVHSLLTWLGIVCLVPFDLCTIDSSLDVVRRRHPRRQRVVNAAAISENEDEDNDDDDETASNGITLVRSILSTSASHLEDYGATRDTAASCLSSLLSRPDLETRELEGFVLWSGRILRLYRTGECAYPRGDVRDDDEKIDGRGMSNSYLLPIPTVGPPSTFLVMGVLRTLAGIFETGHRCNLLSDERKLSTIENLWEECILMSEAGGPAVGSIMLRKLLVKLFARVGCAHLPPKIATWRYQRGRRSLVDNLRGTGSSSASKSLSKGDGSDAMGSTPSSRDLFHVPDQVEDAMDQLLRSLTDPATIVRWSAAKGIGRLTERLPAVCADDVLDAILLLFSDPERDKAWHGACLALAELARRGLLLPNRLAEVVPVVVRAIGYDVRRGQHSVGTHVRDASCYVCWAFARAYAPSVLMPHVEELSVALVLTSLFDREINCRRAASAAFQESVGRQGADNFKHGIAILTTADYYSLGNRVDSFMDLASDIAKFEEYQTPIIRHLAGVKLLHWDVEIRSLASKSLSRISKLNPRYVAMDVLPKLLHQCFHDDIVVRHGSLLGVAETVLAFGESNLVKQGEVLNSETLDSIAELVPGIEKARLYRGRGGEIMRSAACRMIECMSLADVPLTVKQQVRLLDSVDACLIHPKEDIQKSAARALNALLSRYFPVGSKGPSSRLQNRVVDKYISKVSTEDNPAATRGFSLALGHLPAKLLAPSCEVLDSILGCLCSAARKESLVGGEGDAETRRNAIISLVNVCTIVGISTNGLLSSEEESFPIYRLQKQQTDRVFASLLASMEDYNFDRRGDVGSWSRIASMGGLENLAKMTIEASHSFPHSSLACSSYPFRDDVAPSLKTRLVFLSDDSYGNQYPANTEKCKTFFDEQLCCSILSALLKQLGEKLDVVRCKAGECLERLLTEVSPRLPFVPNRNMLFLALNLHEPNNTNWSDPAQTFPLLMRAALIDEFMEPILSGIVISVGGLTESVSKSSSASLFEWIRGLRAAKATSKLFRMGEVFLGLFRQYERNGRVLLPLLSTLDKLLSHEYLNELLCARSGTFRSDLMACLVKEARGCGDIKRLLAMVGVSLALLQPNHETMPIMSRDILPFIMTMLLNPYPRVRRYTAEQLYVKLAEDGVNMFDGDERREEANQLLLNTIWHEENDPLGQLSACRNRIADLLAIDLTEEERLVRIRNVGVFRPAPKDEFESYSSLIGPVC